MSRPVLIAVLAMAATACSKPTELASEKNAKGAITVAAAAPNTPPPELPPEVVAEREGEALPAEPEADPGADPVAQSPSGPATVTDYRPGVAGDINALPPVSDAPALAAAFKQWKAQADANPGAMEPGDVQLGANDQEYRPSDAELVMAEAGDRLAAALRGADEETRTAVSVTLDGATSFRRFNYRRVDVPGAGRHIYASPPQTTSLPL